jgi:hypothetical protein
LKVSAGQKRPASRLATRRCSSAAHPAQLRQITGPLFKFTLSIVKGRLQGDMAGERDGVVRGHAKVDAAKAEKAK